MKTPILAILILGINFALVLPSARAICPFTDLLAHLIVDAPNKGKKESEIKFPPIPCGAIAKVVKVERGKIQLSIWVFNPSLRRNPLGTILVLHGIRDSKVSMAGAGADFARRGYRAILVDLPGQGSSTGNFMTYGVRESDDLKELLNQLDIKGSLGVYGPSFGAATGIILASKDSRVRSVVAVATFSDLSTEVPAMAAALHISFLIPRSEYKPAIARAGVIANFDPSAAAPRIALGNLKIHVLLIHGTADRNIPFSQAITNFRSANPNLTKLIPIEGADHKTIFQGTYGSEVSEYAAAWFKKWL